MTGQVERRVTVGKRPAFESPAVLATPVTPPPTMSRPAATAFGSVLVVLRVVAGVVWLISLAVAWDQIVDDELGFALDPGTQEFEASRLVLGIVLVVGAIVLLVELLFAVLIWFGSNWARIMVMFFATVSITTSWIESVTGDAQITLRTTLITLALDILVLLALSSRNARAYARRPRQRVILHLR